MRRLVYLLLLIFCLVGTLPLEIVLHARVYRRWRRAALAIAPVAAAFVVWDLLAIRAGWWSFDARYVVGLTLPGGLPIEEFLFFLVIPLCALLTFEAVRGMRPGWVVDPAPPPAPQ